MTLKGFTWTIAAVLLTLALLGRWALSAESSDRDGLTSIPPQTVADYIHDVIEADRAFYATHVVERMQVRGIVVSSEIGQSAGTLPLPAQFLMEAARTVAEKRSGIRYRLISLWPIKAKNGPETDFERTGLEEVQKTPDQPYSKVGTSARGRIFQTVYADRAINQSCIGCHNAHPNSPRRDFKRNDVMGGIVITIPMER